MPSTLSTQKDDAKVWKTNSHALSHKKFWKSHFAIKLRFDSHV